MGYHTVFRIVLTLTVAVLIYQQGLTSVWLSMLSRTHY